VPTSTPPLRDMLGGSSPAVLTLRLTDVPLVEPFQLALLAEPDWPNYQPSILQITTQVENQYGWATLEGSATFTLLDGPPPAPLTGMFVVAEFLGVLYLIAVIDLSESEFTVLEPGTTIFQVRFNAFLGPS
jgi:hypothetical protein